MTNYCENDDDTAYNQYLDEQQSLDRESVELSTSPVQESEEFKLLLKQYKEAIKALNVAKEAVTNYSDGYVYVTKTRVYGSIHWQSHSNSIGVREESDEYYGDNGIVDIYTNNPNANDLFVGNYGDVVIMSATDILNMSREEVSMSRAIVNWISR